MTRQQVSRYRYLLKEIGREEAAIDRLLKQKANVPVVAGKVQSSMKEFPYIETHETVEMADPKKNDHLERLIIIKERHIEQMHEERILIEELINSEPDTRTRQILKAVYIDGRSYVSIATELGITKGWVSILLKNFFNETPKKPVE